MTQWEYAYARWNRTLRSEKSTVERTFFTSAGQQEINEFPPGVVGDAMFLSAVGHGGWEMVQLESRLQQEDHQYLTYVFKRPVQPGQ